MSAQVQKGVMTFSCKINWNPVFLSNRLSGIKKKQTNRKNVCCVCKVNAEGQKALSTNERYAGMKEERKNPKTYTA